MLKHVNMKGMALIVLYILNFNHFLIFGLIVDDKVIKLLQANSLTTICGG